MFALILHSMRPRQWSKNGVVLAGLVFSGSASDPASVMRALGALAVFCLLSGAAYLLNDITDREADARHPEKASRPVASGALSVRAAAAGAISAGALGLAGASWLGPGFWVVALAFVCLNAAYSLVLKGMVLVDVMAIAASFVLRAAAGAVVLAVELSPWLLICAVLLALFLALVKRKHELVALGEASAGHRPALADYSAPFLDQLITIVAAATITAYALYTMAPDVRTKLNTEHLDLTIPFVLYGIFRYLYVAHIQGGGGNPSRVLLEDKPLLAAIGLWLVTVGVLLYG